MITCVLFQTRIKYVSKKYADRPHHQLRIADENFGILKRDVEIAQAIKKCNEKFGYPKSVFFYNDKRFKDGPFLSKEKLTEEWINRFASNFPV